LAYQIKTKGFIVQKWRDELTGKLQVLNTQNIQNLSDDHLNQFISILENHPLLRGIYSESVGLWEGYSLRRHTLMVLKQYMKYFAVRNLPQTDKEPFLIVLALHDIGKPFAVSKGDKGLQHFFTKQIVNQISDHLPFDIKNYISLIDGDPIGEFFKGKDLKESVEQIKKMANETSFSKELFFQLLTTYYQTDAGSYTKDAGGEVSLEFLFNNFEFNDQQKRLWFSPFYENIFKQLETSFLNKQFLNKQ
jgi:hypothetical protein